MTAFTLGGSEVPAVLRPDLVRDAVSAGVRSGRADAGQRKRTQRRGRERGCWVYIAAEALERSGLSLDDPPPWYRVWGGKRGRYIVVLYATN